MTYIVQEQNSRRL